MKVIDLFSGIGGFSLGLERAGMETVAFCEIDPFCQAVLKKHWPDVPIYEDVKEFNYDGRADLICGGFPCQPYSVAGQQRGKEDDRDLWPVMFSVIKKYRPSWVIGENVTGFVNMALDAVLTDLESEGYETRAFLIPACGLNAPHKRERVWILGYSEHNGSLTTEESGGAGETGDNNTQGQDKASKPKRTGESRNDENVADTGRKPERCEKSGFSRKQLDGEAQGVRTKEGDRPTNSGKNVANPDTGQCNRSKKEICSRGDTLISGSKANATDTDSQRGRSGDTERKDAEAAWELRGGSWKDGTGMGQWDFEPDVGRVANGVPRRVDRLKSLGNAVVPQIPEVIGRAIMEIENEKKKKAI